MKTQLMLSIGLLFSTFFIYSQNPLNPRDSINYFFSELNQNEIAYNILLDKAHLEI